MSLSVRLEHPDHPPFWLIGNPLENERLMSKVLNEGMQINRDQQTIGGAAWRAKQFRDQGNQSVIFDFSCTREFANSWEQMDFISRLAPITEEQELHAWSGNVYLRYEDGLDYCEFPLPNAVVSLSAAVASGQVGVNLRYSIKAGGMGLGVLGRTVLVALGISEDDAPASIRLLGSELDEIVSVYEMVPGDRVELVVSRDGEDAVVRSYQIGNHEGPPVGEVYLPLSSYIEYLTVTMDLEHPGVMTHTLAPAPPIQDYTFATTQVGEDAYIALRFFRVGEESEEMVHAIESGGAAGPFEAICDGDDYLVGDLGLTN